MLRPTFQRNPINCIDLRTEYLEMLQFSKRYVTFLVVIQIKS